MFVRKSFYSFFLPSLLSCLGIAAGSLADCIFVGNAIGPVGMPALSIWPPIYMLFNANSYALSIGSSIHYTHTLSEGKEEGKRIFVNVLRTDRSLNLRLCILGLLFLPQVLTFLGAGEPGTEGWANCKALVHAQPILVRPLASQLDAGDLDHSYKTGEMDEDYYATQDFIRDLVDSNDVEYLYGSHSHGTGVTFLFDSNMETGEGGEYEDSGYCTLDTYMDLVGDFQYVDAGNYLERVLPFLGIRFIAVGNRYEQYKAGEFDAETFLGKKAERQSRKSQLEPELAALRSEEEQLTEKLYALLNRVIISSDREIEIRWKLDDCFSAQGGHGPALPLCRKKQLLMEFVLKYHMGYPYFVP